MGKGILSGYKTYITAGLTILGTVAAWLTGTFDGTIGEAVNIIVTAVLGITIRAGIKADSSK